MSLRLPRVEATYKCFSVLRAEKNETARDERSSMMERGDEKKKKGKAIRSKERNRLTEGKREREKERERD